MSGFNKGVADWPCYGGVRKEHPLQDTRMLMRYTHLRAEDLVGLFLQMLMRYTHLRAEDLVGRLG